VTKLHVGSVFSMYVVHDCPLYTVCPDELSTVGETSEEIWVGFIESGKVVTILLFIHLFVSEVQSLLLSG
jgi:hypothetical protein